MNTEQILSILAPPFMFLAWLGWTLLVWLGGLLGMFPTTKPAHTTDDESADYNPGNYYAEHYIDSDETDDEEIYNIYDIGLEHVVNRQLFLIRNSVEGITEKESQQVLARLIDHVSFSKGLISEALERVRENEQSWFTTFPDQ